MYMYNNYIIHIHNKEMAFIYNLEAEIDALEEMMTERNTIFDTNIKKLEEQILEVEKKSDRLEEKCKEIEEKSKRLLERCKILEDYYKYSDSEKTNISLLELFDDLDRRMNKKNDSS